MQLEVKDLYQKQRSRDETIVLSYLSETAKIKSRMADCCMESILMAADLMADTLRLDGKVLLCGNGGSAADCQHMAGELVNWLSKDFPRPGLAAIALTTDASVMTAIANDSGFETVFARQIEALGKPGDVLIGISTSGNSANIIRAVRAAQKIGMKAIALTGEGGKLAKLADVVVSVPSQNTQYIQEAHLAVEHILCSLVEQHLFADTGGDL